jgi:hypothetical protein
MTKRYKFDILTQLFHTNPNNQIRFDFFAKQIIRKIREEWMKSIFGEENEEIYKKEYEGIPHKWDPYIDSPKDKWKYYTADNRPDYWQGTK